MLLLSFVIFFRFYHMFIVFWGLNLWKKFLFLLVCFLFQKVLCRFYYDVIVIYYDVIVIILLVRFVVFAAGKNDTPSNAYTGLK